MTGKWIRWRRMVPWRQLLTIGFEDIFPIEIDSRCEDEKMSEPLWGDDQRKGRHKVLSEIESVTGPAHICESPGFL